MGDVISGRKNPINCWWWTRHFLFPAGDLKLVGFRPVGFAVMQKITGFIEIEGF